MSTKATPQHGRRTPLSLSGSTGAKQQHQQLNKQSQGPNGNTTNANTKVDKSAGNANQKLEPQQAVEVKEATPKLTQKQINAEKKLQAANNETPKKADKNEDKKGQNGVGRSSSSNSKDNSKQQNGNDSATKEKKEKTNDKSTPSKDEKKDKNESRVEKLTKDEQKEKEQQPLSNDEKKEKEIEKKAIDDETTKDNKKQERDEAVGSKSSPSTPKRLVVNTEGKSTTVTPKKSVDIAPGKTSTTTTPKKVTITCAIDDFEMEPLLCNTSPIKASVALPPPLPLSSITNNNPTATSTPGKVTASNSNKRFMVPKSDIQMTMERGRSPDRNNCPRSFTQIAGRRSIRPISDYTPSRFQTNVQFRESYRRINTELDVTSNTNTSLNVTVGSEVPNNSSFSFFGRGRKRERTTPPPQSTMELQNDTLSPPKRVRLDVHGFFSAVASPLSLLRSRFSRTSIHTSSTPMKTHDKNADAIVAEDEDEVQNVSGISIEEEVPSMGKEIDNDVTVGGQEKNGESGVEAQINNSTAKDDIKSTEGIFDSKEYDDKYPDSKDVPDMEVDDTDGIKITETPIVGTTGKNKRCNIM